MRCLRSVTMVMAMSLICAAAAPAALAAPEFVNGLALDGAMLDRSGGTDANDRPRRLLLRHLLRPEARALVGPLRPRSRRRHAALRDPGAALHAEDRPGDRRDQQASRSSRP